MPNITNLNSNNLTNQNYQLLVKAANGNVKAVNLSELIGLAYGKYTDCNDPLYIQNPVWSNGTNKIFTDVCNVVDVGIGTATPQYKLHVNGVIHSNKSLFGRTSSTTNAILNVFTLSGNSDIVQFGVNNFSTNDQSVVRFSINNTGTVNINAINNEHLLIAKNGQGEKILQLENNGLLRAREIRVDDNNWPDYVFNKDYKILKLEDLEQFIKTNKHLPKIPTALNIKNNGLNIGVIQHLQMEKIEELTLYLIEQNKKLQELEALKNENLVLKKELETLKKDIQEIKNMLK